MTRKFEERRNEKGQKLYPFSIQKHAHDIEFRYNRMCNVLSEMQTAPEFGGRTDYTHEEFDKLYDEIEEFREVYEAMFHGYSSVAWLTGRQLSLAKDAVAWAHDTRAETQLQKRFN